MGMFENCLSGAIMKIDQGMHFTADESERTISEIIDAMEKYTIGATNETYERFGFQQRRQDESESFDNFFSNLQVLSKTRLHDKEPNCYWYKGPCHKT